MSVCMVSRLQRLLRGQQWRGRCDRATGEGGFPQGKYEGFTKDLSKDLSRTGNRYGSRLTAQLLSSALIRLSNSSNEVSPLIFSPLRKKVGVESTFRTSDAYCRSATILSNKA